MTLTPYMVLILAAYAVVIGPLGVVWIWSNAGERRSAKVKSTPSVESGETRQPTS